MLCATNGYADVSDAYLEAARTGALSATVVGALWWDRDRARSRFRIGGPARGDDDRAAALRVGKADAGRDRGEFTAAMTAPYRDSCGHAPATAALSFIDPERCRICRRTRPERVPVAFSCARGPGRAGRAERGRAGAAGPTARATPGRISPTAGGAPRRRRAIRGARAMANIQALWAAHEPQMDELTLPFLDADSGRWQYRSAICTRPGRGWRRAATGRSQPRSDAGHPCGGQPGVAGDRSRAVPPGSGSLAVALERLYGRVGVCESPRRHRADRAGLPGRLAVLDRDPFAGPPDEIGATRVAMTFVDGRAVHCRPE